MKLIFDVMGVLLDPAHLIKHAMTPYINEDKGLNLPYGEIKRRYKLASRGDAKALNELLSIDEQRAFLDRYVKRRKDFSAFEKLVGKYNLYLLTNMPCDWGIHIYKRFFEKNVMGVYISGCCTMKKPEEMFFANVKMALTQEGEEKLIYFDDKEENIQSAKKAGFEAQLIKEDGALEEALAKLLY